MSIAYESVSSTAAASGDTVVITKPTGLAVGDHMWAQINGTNGVGGAQIVPPAGWTTYYNNTITMSGAAVFNGIFYKQASAGDVSASDFTFTSGGTGRIGGAILRVSGFGIIDGESTRSAIDTTGTVTYASAIDPTFPNSLLMLFMFGGDNASISGADFSSPSIATSNPTWTSRSNDFSAGATTFFRRVYTAPRTADTAFGDISWSVDDGTGSGVGTLVILLNFAPRIDVSHEVVPGTSYFVNHPFLRSGELELNGENPDVASFSKTAWTNEPKPSTSWTKETI